MHVWTLLWAARLGWNTCQQMQWWRWKTPKQFCLNQSELWNSRTSATDLLELFLQRSRMEGDGCGNRLCGVMTHSGPDCYLPLHILRRSTRTLAWTAGSAFPGERDRGLNSTYNHSRDLHNDRKAKNTPKGKQQEYFKPFLQVWPGHFLMVLPDLKFIVTIRKQGPTAPIPFSPRQVLFSPLLQKVSYHSDSPQSLKNSS